MYWLRNSGSYGRSTGAIAIAVALCLSGMAIADDVEQKETDKTVSTRVEHQLRRDTGVDLEKIEVDVSQGILTLDGSVPTLLSKERAAKIGETIRGVRSVVNVLKVVPSKFVTDELIRKDIEAAWLSDPATDSYEVTAEVHDGVATISGDVESYPEKRLCEKVSKSVKGVKEVQNNIMVEYESNRPDVEIKADIDQTHHYNAYIDRTSRIFTSVNDGKVAISGLCGSAAEKARITSDAWVAGVIEVDASKLETNGYLKDDDRRKEMYPDVTDEAITEAVVDALLYDPRVSMFNIDVKSDLRRVTLKGEVDNLKAKRSAVQDARNTYGVWYVYDRIQIIPTADVTDTAIRQKVKAALERNALLNGSTIDVAVKNGIARLTGTVNTYFGKAYADDVASTVYGVAFVNNDVNVIYTDIGLRYQPFIDPIYPYDFDWYDYEPAPVVKPDGEIEQSINDEMWWSPFIDADQVTVSVDSGEATLTGKVDSWYEREKAVENALEGGARKVINKLEYVD